MEAIWKNKARLAGLGLVDELRAELDLRLKFRMRGGGRGLAWLQLCWRHSILMGWTEASCYHAASFRISAIRFWLSCVLQRGTGND